jgi:uncharacterized repeat protein (TIGR01451 family)
MKNLYLLAIAFCFGIAAKAQTINFPDANFKNMLLTANTNNLIALNASDVFIKIDTNNDGEIQIEEALLVKKLQFNGYNFEDQSNVALSVIGLEYFDGVESIIFDDKYLPVLDVSGMASLKYISTSYTKITAINASGSASLLEINLMNMSITNTIDVSNAVNLRIVGASGVQLHSINVQGAINLKELYCSSNFWLDTLNVSGLTNLEILKCSNIYHLTSLDLSTLTNLKTLTCSETSIVSLDVSGLANLKTLDCRGSSHNNNSEGTITSLILNGATSLENLDCSNNHITSLDAGNKPNLSSIEASGNNITTFNIVGSTAIQYLDCGENNISELNLNGMVNLQRLNCGDNALTTLDVSDSPLLVRLSCDHNNLETLYMKNGANEGANNYYLYFNWNPNLRYICADDFQLQQIQTLLNNYGYTNCEVNSYCYLAPGGVTYNINGNNRFDFDANGCDENDTNFPYLKFNINDGTDLGTQVSDASGSYSIAVKAGTTTITPVFENPDYFNVSPTSATVIFPAQTAPLIQNFCVSANGVHNDAEVNIIPISRVRAGFDVMYKIIYKNKGNQLLSGTISFAYNDAVLDFVSASVAPSSLPMNYINWYFTNLKPFESKEIYITLNLNSPVEIPAVNSGFILNYTMSVNTGATDETPADNNFVLTQTVVNSFDPNDKVCLEGNTITPDKIGKYVHYVIHFENTGTAEAENIVVKDMIDTTKFDISSLEVLAGSHPFTTKISTQNKVEFIFENINLPFDDANNDGYIAFKIKTLPSLTNGDSFSNSASIYFDFNAPINTPPAVTTVHSLLADADFNSSTFTVTPNPATNTIYLSNVASKYEVQITSILGEVVVKTSNSCTIDISHLAKGIYLINVKQGDKTTTQKLIKN